MSGNIVTMKKSNRQAYLLPWHATAPRPWSDKHERVVIPYTNDELRTAHDPNKVAHIQIVRRENLRFD